MIGLVLAALFTPEMPACDPKQAARVDLRAISRAPERYLDRCVRLTGYVSGNRFYSDVGGFYASVASDSDERHNDGWLGVYSRSRKPSPDLVHASLTGVVGDCRRMYDDAVARAGPNTIVMLFGYCHYTSGLVLRSAIVERGRTAVFERQAGRAARDDFGDLTEVRSTELIPPVVPALTSRFVRDLRNHDNDALTAFVVPYTESLEPHSAEARAFSTWLTAPTSSIAFIGDANEPQRAYFYERQTAQDQVFGYFPAWHVCFCRVNTCVDRWPISSIDADAAPERPYACVRTVMSDRGLSDPPRQLGIVRSGGLPEPS